MIITVEPALNNTILSSWFFKVLKFLSLYKSFLSLFSGFGNPLGSPIGLFELFSTCIELTIGALSLKEN